MKIQRGLHRPTPATGSALTIGNFDGVHRGHQSVLRRALDEAEARGVPALVLTFEPHPRTFFSPNTPQFKLTDLRNKLRLLAVPPWVPAL